jgi:nitrate reductase gamma subunit
VTTGLIIETARYLPGAPTWAYWIFIFHVAVSITLLLLLPFTKFAHSICRIVALDIQALKSIAEVKSKQTEADAAD